jgi:hypothetical protein
MSYNNISEIPDYREWIKYYSEEWRKKYPNISTHIIPEEMLKPLYDFYVKCIEKGYEPTHGEIIATALKDLLSGHLGGQKLSDKPDAAIIVWKEVLKGMLKFFEKENKQTK